jgi:DNA polymerase-3 subunit epsilon
VRATANAQAAKSAAGWQTSFQDLGTPLVAATFVVVDLETTGSSPSSGEITEIGAVKVRGGEVLGEFQTLVDPGAPIPPLIASLTGITDAAVHGAPSAAGAVAAFLEFSAGAILVAHNAPYDTGFLRGACAKHDLPWPKPAVLDTARIARATLLRDEVPNYRLATLARLADAATQPCHRALADARATVDVLHYLIGRVGDLGITTAEELAALTRRVSPERRRKRTLADGLPNGPGVYQFLDSQDRPLYIGTSRRVRDRVRSYFTAAEQRPRMAEMVGLTARVGVIPCATALEAAVRETRLLEAHKPPYNRRSRFPERQTWVKLTVEPFPRLSAVQRPADDRGAGASYLGPLANRRTATAVIEAVQRAFPIRSCTDRLPLHPVGTACLAADLGHCLAPCEGRVDRSEYADLIDAVRTSWETAFGPAARRMMAAAEQHARRGEYERAGEWRNALQTLAEAVVTTQRHAMLARCGLLVAAAPTAARGWQIHVIRYGRLAAAGVAEPGTDPRAAVDRLLSCAEDAGPAPGGAPAASLTELGHIHRWLAEPGVRLVHAEPSLHMPASSVHTVLGRLRAARAAALPAAATTPTGGSGHERPGRVTRIAL